METVAVNCSTIQNNMKNLERKQLTSIKAIADKPTFFVRAFCEGLGVMMSEGFAYVGNAVIDLRFDNLKPEIKIQK